MFSRRPLVFGTAALLSAATIASAAVGTMCRNQDPFLNCEGAIAATVTPRCEAFDDKAVKTSCICSTMSQITSCYVSLCPRDNLNDVYDTFLNSLSCPGAPPLTKGVFKTTGVGAGITPTVTPATTGAGTGSAPGPAATTSRSAAAQPAFQGTAVGRLLLGSVGGVFGVVGLVGVLL